MGAKFYPICYAGPKSRILVKNNNRPNFLNATLSYGYRSILFSNKLK